MKKRLKSFAITFASLLVTVFAAVAVSPQWAAFLAYAQAKLVTMGLSPIVVALIAVTVSEIWKQILNNQTLKKSGKLGGGSYPDYSNELY